MVQSEQRMPWVTHFVWLIMQFLNAFKSEEWVLSNLFRWIFFKHQWKRADKEGGKEDYDIWCKKEYKWESWREQNEKKPGHGVLNLRNGLLDR